MLRRSPERYKGSVVAAAPGTHEAASRMVAKYCKPDAALLDLGAYTGALIQRLKDRGYTNATAADLDNHLTVSGIRHVACDFNEAFGSNFPNEQFDCIIASEVIEHLNDIRAFLRECASLLKEGGIIVVTTPNIGFFEGRIKFLLKGELFGFGGSNYRSQRHISPVSLEQFPLLFEETGFDTLELFTTASFATPLRKVLTIPFWVPMRLAFGATVLGETTVCVGRKSGSKGRFMSELWKKNKDTPVSAAEA
jgi:SAM-dependent methyltransferase